MAKRKRIILGRMAFEQLLELRICDLPVRLSGTLIERRIRRLHRELEARGIVHLPHVWISDEFFTPDGVGGFAIPFYLTHPRLVRLERRQMLEVEGGPAEQSMRILRHEAGHALDNAYKLHWMKSWKDVFGVFSRKYPESYKPNPNSRNHVLHLDAWYAQAHPAEDWAETFAVWLRGPSWKRRYQGWPAMKKLEYVDRLMTELAGTRPVNSTREIVEPISEITRTLKRHYHWKHRQYSLDYPAFYDRDLRKIFTVEKNSKSLASTFLRHYRREVRQLVANGTGVHPYTIDHVFKNIIDRARQLKLRVESSEKKTKIAVLIMLTVHTMNIVHSGRYRFHYGI